MTSLAHHMSFPMLLRRALLADAAASLATGLLLVFGGTALHALLHLPERLMLYAGLSLLPFAALVAYVGTRGQPHRAAIWAIVAYNALWAVDSLILLASGLIAPTLLGSAFVTAQAFAVGGFAILQYAGLKQTDV